MVKKNRKRTGYSLIVASGLLLLVGVLLYGLYYVNDVRTELWDSSLSTIIENTDPLQIWWPERSMQKSAVYRYRLMRWKVWILQTRTPSAFC